MVRTNTPRAARTVLLSIHPLFAAAVYAGTKGWEFRRVRTAIRPGDRVIIYETAPVGRLTGEFSVGWVRVGDPAEILTLADRAAGPGAAEYLAGASVVSALQVTSPRRWAHAYTLEEAGLGRYPPLSYRFVRTI